MLIEIHGQELTVEYIVKAYVILFEYQKSIFIPDRKEHKIIG